MLLLPFTKWLADKSNHIINPRQSIYSLSFRAKIHAIRETIYGFLNSHMNGEPYLFIVVSYVTVSRLSWSLLLLLLCVARLMRTAQSIFISALGISFRSCHFLTRFYNFILFRVFFFFFLASSYFLFSAILFILSA